MPRALGDVVSARRSSATAWRGPLVHGLLHLLGYDHGAEMEAREAAALRERPRRTPSLIESLNYAFEGIIHVLRTQRNLRIHFAVAVRAAGRARLGVAGWS